MINAKKSYTTYEFGVEIDNYGEVIILANTRKEDNKDLLEISLKTSENAGITFLVVGYFIDDNSELGIKNEIERLAGSAYFDDFIFSAIGDEGTLESCM